MVKIRLKKKNQRDENQHEINQLEKDVMEVNKEKIFQLYKQKN